MSSNPLSVIPAERLEAVKKAISQSFPGENITSVTLLSGGLSGSSVYKISLAKGIYVLKLNPQNEVQNFKPGALALAAYAGVAPRFFF